MKKRLLVILTVVICLLTVAAGNIGAAENPLWLRYPAISPDGGAIVFCYKGDIFKVPAVGGQAQPLTSHAAYDLKPVWSPDGRFIAFASDRSGNFDIYILPIEGGEPTRLTFNSANEYPNSFTPDGKFILFSAAILDYPKNAQFPNGVLSELYKVPVESGSGRTVQVLSTPALEARYDKAGKHILYQDRKGVEDIWRKHHTSSVTRDIRLYDVDNQKHIKLSPFKGEDLSPVFSSDETSVYYLSEQFGTFNVCKLDPAKPGQVEPITHHETHPVRFLSISNQDTLCYSYHGEIYTKALDREPMKVLVQIAVDRKQNPVQFQTLTDGATEMALSPDGKEIAFVTRGEVFVASVEYGTTKRITNTPEQERSVSFSPDGRTLLYAGERNGSWNLYQTTISRKEEKHFSAATLLTKAPLLEIPEETFQPLYSPDGKEVAYLEERTILKVINLKTRAVRTILGKEYNYSYTDGDMWFQWSPDGQQFLVTYFGVKRWNTNVGLVDALGNKPVVNLTESGYFDRSPKWILEGKAMMWLSDREGMRSHGSWGSQRDVYAMFFDQAAFDRFQLTKEEFEAVKEKEKEEQEKDKDQKKGKEKDEANEKGKNDIAKPFIPNLEDREDRLVRWTVNSSDLSDMVLSPDGETLYYLSKFEGGHDLWMNKPREKETKLLVKLTGRGGSLQIDKEGKKLFLLSDGKILKVDTGEKKSTPIAFKAEFNLNREAEYRYLFEHIWRQVLKKFYAVDMDGVDWQFFKKAYAPFLAHIENNYDFSEMLSEMLGELNASHTGCFYRPQSPDGDETARLGAFYDETYTGNGLKILEIIDKSPLGKAPSLIKAGVIIEKIDGQLIEAGKDYDNRLNHKAGKPTLLSLYNPADGKRWEETIKPITFREENELLYRRWVKNRREETEKLSKGRIGYVHVRSMNDSSFRVAYAEILGRENNKDAMIVDTRFNGGGHLHEDLAKLLGGKKYFKVEPRGQDIGIEPRDQWCKPSVVLISEGNYSNAHGFPYVYKKLGLGKLVGMPVPGTMTSVWWERLQDQTLVFGIPMVGYKDEVGHYLENQQLDPDFVEDNEFSVLVTGRDQQLEKAVQVLLEILAKKE
jgi:tricorn protease